MKVPSYKPVRSHEYVSLYIACTNDNGDCLLWVRYSNFEQIQLLCLYGNRFPQLCTDASMKNVSIAKTNLAYLE